MTPAPRPRRGRSGHAAPSAEAGPAQTGLAALGVAAGDAVRFRRREGERWKEATVARREKDGSIGLHDAKGASRSIALELIEVRAIGPRGGTVWEPLAVRAERTEQLAMVPGAGRSQGSPARGASGPAAHGTAGEAPPSASEPSAYDHAPAHSGEQLRLL